MNATTQLNTETARRRGDQTNLSLPESPSKRNLLANPPKTGELRPSSPVTPKELPEKRPVSERVQEAGSSTPSRPAIFAKDLEVVAA